MEENLSLGDLDFFSADQFVGELGGAPTQVDLDEQVWQTPIGRASQFMVQDDFSASGNDFVVRSIWQRHAPHTAGRDERT